MDTVDERKNVGSLQGIETWFPRHTSQNLVCISSEVCRLRPLLTTGKIKTNKNTGRIHITTELVRSLHRGELTCQAEHNTHDPRTHFLCARTRRV
jgi:hypothetical protein